MASDEDSKRAVLQAYLQASSNTKPAKWRRNDVVDLTDSPTPVDLTESPASKKRLAWIAPEEWFSHRLAHQLEREELSVGPTASEVTASHVTPITEPREKGPSGPGSALHQVPAPQQMPPLLSSVAPRDLTTPRERIDLRVGAKVGGEVTARLRQCLVEQPVPRGGLVVRAALAGSTWHAAIKREDKGWGCGWRNIQMLSGSLIHQCEGARRMLFGGLGSVPGVGGLEACLEAAWKQGFDRPGAEQLGGKVQGARKGTHEGYVPRVVVLSAPARCRR